jgi:murein DD-endopeptidase / murein LD-carboxypeptidase
MYLSAYNKYYTFLLALLLLLSACGPSKKATSTEGKENNSSNKLKAKYAELLNVNEKKIDNLKLYSFIDDWYGMPYKFGGKNKSGIDCSSFAAQLYSTVYNKTLSGTAASIFYQCKPISQNNMEEGDLVFFKIESKNITHIGIYLQNNKFVHAGTKKGVRIEDLNEPYFKKYFFKAGRLKN